METKFDSLRPVHLIYGGVRCVNASVYPVMSVAHAYLPTLLCFIESHLVSGVQPLVRLLPGGFEKHFWTIWRKVQLLKFFLKRLLRKSEINNFPKV